MENQTNRVTSTSTAKKKKRGITALLERIPITGLHNYLYAETTWERRLWTCTLLIAIAVTLHYLIPTIVLFCRFAIVMDLQLKTDDRPPYPVTYAGFYGGRNKTAFDGFLDALNSFQNESRFQLYFNRSKAPSPSAFISHILMFATTQTNENFGYSTSMVDAYNEILYKTVQRMGTNWTGYNSFYEDGLIKCESFLRRCEYNGVPFVCCPDNAETTLSAGASVFYKLNVTAVVPNGGKQSSTQTEDRLVLETVIDTGNHPSFWQYAGSLAVNFGDTTPTLFDPVTIIPHGSTGFVKLKATRRKLMYGCVERFELDINRHRLAHDMIQEYYRNMSDPKFYSVEKCTMAQLIEELYIRCGCVLYYDTLKPNDTIICKPMHLYACLGVGLQTSNENTYKPPISAKNGGSNNNAQNDILHPLKERSKECKPLCDTWQYQVHVTYAPFAGNFSTENRSVDVVYNRLIVTLDSNYYVANDVHKMDFDRLMATMGEGLSLCLGLSLISFIQAIYWTLAAIRFKRNMRRVHPLSGA